MQLSIINGPNLNILGQRAPEIYGNESFENFLNTLRTRFPEVTLDYFQSNEEGAIISKLQNCKNSNGIILNAAAYSHTSIAIADAVEAIDVPVVEVHISNIFSREEYRHHSFISAKSKGMICGLGLEGYTLAISYFLHQQL